MKHLILIASLLLLVAFGAGHSAPTLHAQDDMMTHTCDSTLITLLYIAEHDYGFQSMTTDVTLLEKGQFAPLFDAMMAMMDDMAMADDAMTEEPMTDDMAMDDAMMSDDMVMLTPGHIEGEDPVCTALREEVEAFLYDTFTASMMMESEG